MTVNPSSILLTNGQFAVITGFSDSRYNGTFKITAISTSPPYSITVFSVAYLSGNDTISAPSGGIFMPASYYNERSVITIYSIATVGSFVNITYMVKTSPNGGSILYVTAIYNDNVGFTSGKITIGTQSVTFTSGIVNTLTLTTSLLLPATITFSAINSSTSVQIGGIVSLRLNSYDGLSDFVFVDTSTQVQTLLLPVASLFPQNKLLYIKDKSNSASTHNVAVSPAITDKIETNTAGTPFIISSTAGCLTLFSGSPTSGGTLQYFIANYYPSSYQGLTDTSPPDHYSYKYTIPDNSFPVTIFNTTTDRTGNNLCTLPSLSTNSNYVGINMVAYGGQDGSGRGSGNALYFNTADNTKIDNRANYYYITSDAGTNKSVGMVFISDGITWYIAGMTQMNNWSWSTTLNAATNTNHINIESTPTNTNIITIIPNTNTSGDSRNVVLPLTKISNSYCVLVKAQSHISQLSFVSADGVSGHTQNLFNGNNVINYYLQGHDSTYSCIWFVSQTPPGSTITYYYPVINYTPNF